ncbi:MAG: tetratricopeptide repeat protein [bacterium]
MKSSYFIFLLIPSLCLVSCVTPGEIKQEDTSPQIQADQNTKETEKVSNTDVSLADAIQSNEEVKVEQERIKGRIEKLEFDLNNKLNEINKRLDQIVETVKNEKQDQGLQATEETHSTQDAAQTTQDTQATQNIQTAQNVDQVTTIEKSESTEKVEPMVTKGVVSQTEIKKVDLSKINIEERYKTAKKMEQNKKYEEAEKYYTSIIGTTSKWYDERARFFLGSMYYDMGKFKDSIVALQDLIEKYPNSKNIPSSMLTQAESFVSLKQKKDAEIFFKDLITRFPKTKEAEKAKARLKKI